MADQKRSQSISSCQILGRRRGMRSTTHGQKWPGEMTRR